MKRGDPWRKNERMKSVASILRKAISRIHRARFSDYMIAFINVDDTADSFDKPFVLYYVENSPWGFKRRIPRGRCSISCSAE